MKKRGLIACLAVLVLAGLASFAFDKQISAFAVSLQNPFLDIFFSIFGSWIFIAAVFLIAGAILLRKHKKKHALALALSVICALAVASVLKIVFARDRPFGLTEVYPLLNLQDYSFPSSHTASIFSMLPVLDEYLKKFEYIWIALAVIVGLSRVYFGEHYLSDVIFGMIFGYASGYLVNKLINRKK